MPAGTWIDPTTISLSKGDYCICTCLFISVVTICIYTKADTTHIAIYMSNGSEKGFCYNELKTGGMGN